MKESNFVLQKIVKRNGCSLELSCRLQHKVQHDPQTNYSYNRFFLVSKHAAGPVYPDMRRSDFYGLIYFSELKTCYILVLQNFSTKVEQTFEQIFFSLSNTFCRKCVVQFMNKWLLRTDSFNELLLVWISLTNPELNWIYNAVCVCQNVFYIYIYIFYIFK